MGVYFVVLIQFIPGYVAGGDDFPNLIEFYLKTACRSGFNATVVEMTHSTMLAF